LLCPRPGSTSWCGTRSAPASCCEWPESLYCFSSRGDGSLTASLLRGGGSRILATALICSRSAWPENAHVYIVELLAELPTRRPPPLYRRWAEVPLPARVHVHGLPGGGDDAIFRGAPAFSATLWRCTGYVPKMCNLLKLKDSRPDLDSVELQTNCDGKCQQILMNLRVVPGQTFCSIMN